MKEQREQSPYYKRRMEERKRLIEDLKTAHESNDLGKMQRALQAVNNERRRRMPFTDNHDVQLYNQVNAHAATLRKAEALEVNDELKTALESNDPIPALEDVLQRAKNASLNIYAPEFYKKIETHLEELRREEQIKLYNVVEFESLPGRKHDLDVVG